MALRPVVWHAKRNAIGPGEIFALRGWCKVNAPSGLPRERKTQLANSCEVRVALQPISQALRAHAEPGQPAAAAPGHDGKRVQLSMNVPAAHLAASALWQSGGRVFQPTFWAVFAEGGGEGTGNRDRESGNRRTKGAEIARKKRLRGRGARGGAETRRSKGRGCPIEETEPRRS